MNLAKLHIHVPITVECPVSCLGLSQHTYRPLVRNVADPTVGAVLELIATDHLELIRGIGPSRVEETVASLMRAGLLHHSTGNSPGSGG